jgi:3-oxoacyl-[acyl-carrier protein] reductase
MPLPLAEQVAVVTGAASGIGAAIALHLADRGAHVAVVHKDAASQEAAEAVAIEIRRLGRRAEAIACDVTVRAQVAAMAARAAAAIGPIDILVNNVGGLIETRRFVDVDDALWDRIFDLNLKSAFICTQAVLPGMLARKRGAIVNISSIAAETGAPGGSIPYAAAKGGMNTLTVGLARELAESGVRVNAVAPGLIATPFHAGHERSGGSRVATIPLGRMGEPEEVARVVGWLVGPEAAYVTGQVWTVAGGR